MEVWNNRLLVADGGWDDVNRAAISVRSSSMDRLVRQQAIPASNGIAYWTAVPRSIASVGLFYIQSAPLLTTKMIWDSNFPKESSLENLKHAAGREWSRWSSIKSATSLSTYCVAKFRGFGIAFSQLAIRISREETERLESQRREAAQQIGRLLVADPNSFSTKDPAFVKSFVGSGVVPQSNDKEASKGKFSVNSEVTTPAEASFALQQMLDHSSEQTANIKQVIPSAVTRWWPLAFMLGAAAYKSNGSWADLVNWAQQNIVKTSQSFWQNWIVEPLIQVYQTIRHDPTEKMGLIAKESSPSDRMSSERMVVDFAKDMNSHLSAEELHNIGQAAANGNMEPVMAVYEKQIGSPVLNLVTGKLMRTMLIQVQKSKVDLEVALSGIDQLLQSQQLVFGLVAAIPAFGVLWWLTSVCTSYLYERIYGSRATKSEKNAVFRRLQESDRVAQNAEGSKLTLEEVGLVYCSVVMLRDIVPDDDSPARQQLRQCLTRIEEHAIARDTQAVSKDMDRTYARYIAAKIEY